MFKKLFSDEEKYWQTVAIDTRFTWHYLRNPDKSYNHIVCYQINAKTNARRIRLNDALDEGRKYGEEESTSIAKAKVHWVEGGIIQPPKHAKDVVYIDSAYAPHGDFESIINMVNSTPALQSALGDQKQVNDAWNHFVTSVKLCKNL